MARPRSASDEEILTAADRIFGKRGADGFTISELARELELSRTAITLRFDGVERLKLLVAERSVAGFEEAFASLELNPGADGLLAIVETISHLLGHQDNFSNFLLRYNSNIRDPAMLDMEQRRGAVLRDLVVQAMPETRLGKDDAAEAFMANLTGAIMQWQTSDADAESYLRQSTLNWLRLVGIDGESVQE